MAKKTSDLKEICHWGMLNYWFHHFYIYNRYYYNDCYNSFLLLYYVNVIILDKQY